MRADEVAALYAAMGQMRERNRRAFGGMVSDESETIRNDQPLTPLQRADKRIAELEQSLVRARQQQGRAHRALQTERRRRQEAEGALAALRSRLEDIGDPAVSDLLKLCHPDRWEGSDLQPLATKITQWLLRLRRER